MNPLAPLLDEINDFLVSRCLLPEESEARNACWYSQMQSGKSFDFRFPASRVAMKRGTNKPGTAYADIVTGFIVYMSCYHCRLLPSLVLVVLWRSSTGTQARRLLKRGVVVEDAFQQSCPDNNLRWSFWGASFAYRRYNSRT